MKDNFSNVNNPAIRAVRRVQESQKQVKKEEDTNVKQESNTVKQDAGKYFSHQQKAIPKSIMMTIRTKPEIKGKFDSIRAFYNYSQSEFLAAMLVFAEEQAVLDGWKSKDGV